MISSARIAASGGISGEIGEEGASWGDLLGNSGTEAIGEAAAASKESEISSFAFWESGIAIGELALFCGHVRLLCPGCWQMLHL